MNETNPVKASIDWLIEQGFDEDQATNICRAIRADSPEKLWEDAPAWIEWCGKIKREHDCIVQLAAMGLIYVEIGPGGVEDDLRIGLKVGQDERWQRGSDSPRDARCRRAAGIGMRTPS